MKYIIFFFACSLSLLAIPPTQRTAPCANGNTRSLTTIDTDQDGKYDYDHIVDCDGKTYGIRLETEIIQGQVNDFIAADSVDINLYENTNGDISVDVTLFINGVAVQKHEKDFTKSNITVTTIGG